MLRFDFDRIENIVANAENASHRTNERYDLDRVGNIVGKGANDGYQCFYMSLKIRELFDKGLTHYHTMSHFDALTIYSCGKHCEERRNCLFQAISPFLTMFSTL